MSKWLTAKPHQANAPNPTAIIMHTTDQTGCSKYAANIMKTVWNRNAPQLKYFRTLKYENWFFYTFTMNIRSRNLLELSSTILLLEIYRPCIQLQIIVCPWPNKVQRIRIQFCLNHSPLYLAMKLFIFLKNKLSFKTNLSKMSAVEWLRCRNPNFLKNVMHKSHTELSK